MHTIVVGSTFFNKMNVYIQLICMKAAWSSLVTIAMMTISGVLGCVANNQTMAHFKFRNLKQNAHQSVDAYMSQLRLALPECKFKNDADDLLKDQFIFGIHNREIQDHLLGEIYETNNSVKSLYKARNIESKLEQSKFLGIVTPDRLVDINAIKKGGKSSSGIQDCNYCGQNHSKGNCPAYGKTCYKCRMKNHFEK